MKLNLNFILKPFFSLKNSAFFKFAYHQAFARNLYVKITITGMLLMLFVIWALWAKIVLDFYPLVIPFFITTSIPAVTKPYLLPLIISCFVFINIGLVI